jgi:hypothetical protein
VQLLNDIRETEDFLDMGAKVVPLSMPILPKRPARVRRFGGAT